MHWLRSQYVCVLSIGLLPATALAGLSVNAQIATEGRFAIYIGASNGSGVELVAGNDATAHAAAALRALLPQRVTFELPDGKCIYVATWGIQRPEAGLIGEFLFNGMPVYSGDPAWEVYASPLRLQANEAPPLPASVGDEITRASQRYLWKRAAKLVGNGAGPVSMIGQLNRSAAWMWLPRASAKIAPPAVPVDGVLIFRIAPNEIWPEIELNYTQNVGLGSGIGDPAGGGSGSSSFAGGGGGGGGGGSGDLASGGARFNPIFSPFNSFDPPNSFTIPAESPPGGLTSDPIVPSPRDTTPVASSDDNDGNFPPTDTTSTTITKPKPPVDPPPLIPEPATIALLMAGLALLRRR